MPKVTPPFYPLIYVRGYAMTQSEIAAPVATPYMGFNLGATKMRQNWEGRPVRHIFESPLVRLMKDYHYTDIYADGSEIPGEIPARSIVIYRYYEQADQEIGTGKAPSIPDAARGLKKLIHRIRSQVCGDNAEALEPFRVYLVAHSMGGLVVRCFLQNDKISTPADRALVDKVFTYATPHNGIEMAGMNVPRFLDLWDMNNFNRKAMADYLDLPAKSKRVDTLNGRFPPERFFCLVGTDHKDYQVAAGLSRKLAGEMSDGLVKIENAAVQGAPRAFVYRSHSGPYGIVNSEEGYQNLIRFLFGNIRVNGRLEVENLPLPPSVQRARKDHKEIRASYFFEATVSPRGAMTYKLSERRKETCSAIMRKYDEMLKVENTARSEPRWPVLFSVFLDTKRITVGRSILFTVDLAVSTTGYTVEKNFWMDRHIPAEYLFRDTVCIRATPEKDRWTLYYTLADKGWGENRGKKLTPDAQGNFSIPLESPKGFKGRLFLQVGHGDG
jgi:hypothetical protein